MKKFIVLLIVLVIAGCAHKTTIEEATQISKAVFYSEFASPGVQQQITATAVREATFATAALRSEINTKLISAKQAVYDMAVLREVVYFGFNSHVLDSQARTSLQDKAAILLAHPQVTLTIIGHASAEGAHAYNLNLSKARAELCKVYLMALTVPALRLQTTYRGESGSHEQLAEDQYVEFTVHLVGTNAGHPIPPEGYGINPVRKIKSKLGIAPAAPAAPKAKG